ncbi:hypothetical protein [Endozoicomonas sp.]|uniref:hypothetical protein n=1 Tax=Endozoicomonas sp. TaxID=1892382 RepID=UPI0028877A25|nr:hypothetical protein [Endozoicomonas sp.]
MIMGNPEVMMSGSMIAVEAVEDMESVLSNSGATNPFPFNALDSAGGLETFLQLSIISNCCRRSVTKFSFSNTRQPPDLPQELAVEDAPLICFWMLTGLLFFGQKPGPLESDPDPDNVRSFHTLVTPQELTAEDDPLTCFLSAWMSTGLLSSGRKPEPLEPDPDNVRSCDTLVAPQELAVEDGPMVCFFGEWILTGRLPKVPRPPGPDPNDACFFNTLLVLEYCLTKTPALEDTDSIVQLQNNKLHQYSPCGGCSIID